MEPCSLGAAGCPGPNRGKRAWLPAGPLGRCPDHLGWGSGSRADPAGGDLGGSVELPGASGRRHEPCCGPAPQPATGRHLPGERSRGPPCIPGLPSWPVDSPVAPRTNQRCMWPLGSPEGSGRALGLRARWPAGPPGVRLALGFAGFPAPPAPSAAPVKLLDSALPGLNPRRTRKSRGSPSRLHSWPKPFPCCSCATPGLVFLVSVPGSPWAPSWAGQAGPSAWRACNGILGFGG